MVGVFLVIQMPDASDKGSVTLRFRPIDCFFLGFESAELMVRMVFDYIILNGRPFRATLRTGFDERAQWDPHTELHLRRRQPAVDLLRDRRRMVETVEDASDA